MFTFFEAPYATTRANPPFFYTSKHQQLAGDLVISGRRNGLALFWELAGTFTRCAGVIPELS
jgi:hypothetical protein